MKRAFCSLPARFVDPAENARASARGRLYRWWAHFNRPLFARTGKRSWTVHWKGRCIPVNHIESNGAPWETHERRTQPVSVVRGFARAVSTYYSPRRDQMVAEITA